MSGGKVVKFGGKGKNNKLNKPKGIDAEVAQDDITRRINENNPEKSSSESSTKPEDDLDFSEKEKAETMKTILERFPSKPVKGPIPKMRLGYGTSKGHQAELTKKREIRNAWNNRIEEIKQEESKKAQEQSSPNNSAKSEEKQTGTAENEGFLKGLQNATKEGEKTSNREVEPTNEATIESLINRALKAEKQAQAYKDRIAELEKAAADTAEPKADKSGTEETVTPEPKVKTGGEPKTNTEQAQATQEPTKETNASMGTGEATPDNMMTPEDAFNYFKNKDNYEKASNVFETPSFNEYIDSTTGKWIPRGYFDAFNAKDGINPKKFTFEHFKAKIPEDLSKKLTSAEATEELAKRNAALKSYEEEYKKYNTGFQAYLRKHPKLANAIKWGIFGAAGEGAVELGKWLNETYIAGQNDKDELQNIIDGLNDDEPEYPGSNDNNNSNPEDIAAQLKGADESTETPEGGVGIIEQAVEQPTTQNNVKPEATQAEATTVAPNTPVTQNKPVNSTTSTSKNKGKLSDIVEGNTNASSGSNGMVYDNARPDDVTTQLIDAMGQAPQAGSNAIGYGDLYDQNFIDFWAKRNPNLAFGVSQGMR